MHATPAEETGKEDPATQPPQTWSTNLKAATKMPRETTTFHRVIVPPPPFRPPRVELPGPPDLQVQRSLPERCRRWQDDEENQVTEKDAAAVWQNTPLTAALLYGHDQNHHPHPDRLIPRRFDMEDASAKLLVAMPSGDDLRQVSDFSPKEQRAPVAAGGEARPRVGISNAMAGDVMLPPVNALAVPLLLLGCTAQWKGIWKEEARADEAVAQWSPFFDLLGQGQAQVKGPFWFVIMDQSQAQTTKEKSIGHHSTEGKSLQSRGAAQPQSIREDKQSYCVLNDGPYYKQWDPGGMFFIFMQ